MGVSLHVEVHLTSFSILHGLLKFQTPEVLVLQVRPNQPHFFFFFLLLQNVASGGGAIAHTRFL